MTLENLLQNLTDAVVANTAARARVADVLASAPAEVPPAAATREPAAPVEPVAEVSTLEHVKDATVAAIKAKGREAVAAILSEFGLKRAGDAKPEHFDALVGKLRA